MRIASVSATVRQAVFPAITAWQTSLRLVPSTGTAVTLLCLVGIVPRALAVHATLDRQPLGGDAMAYLNAADVVRNLALGTQNEPWWQIEPILNRGPLYPVLIALLGGGADRTIAPLLVLQVLLGGLTCLLVYLLATRLAGPAIGLTACAIVALLPSLVEAPAAVMTEPVRIPVGVAIVLAIAHAKGHLGFRGALGIGLLVAAFTMLYASLSAVAVAVLLLGIAWLRARPRSWWLGPMLVGPFILTIVLHTITSLSMLGYVIVPGSGGVSGGDSWAGFVRARTETFGLLVQDDLQIAGLNGNFDSPPVRERLERGGADLFVPPLEPEVANAVAVSVATIGYPRVTDDVFRRAWLRRVTEDPLGYVRLVVLNVGRLIGTPHDAGADGETQLSQRLHLLVSWLALVGLVSPLTPLSRWARFLLAAIPMSSMVLEGMLHPEARYWVTSLPFLTVLAVAGAWAIIKGLRMPLGGPILLAAVAAAIAARQLTELIDWAPWSLAYVTPPVLASGVLSATGWTLLVFASALVARVRSARGVAILGVAFIPFLLLQFASVTSREPITVLFNATTVPAPRWSGVSLTQRWSDVSVPSGARVEVLFGIMSGLDAVSVSLNGVPLTPDTTRKLPNSWQSFSVPPEAISGSREWSFEVRLIDMQGWTVLGTIAPGDHPDDVWAPSLRRQIVDNDAFSKVGPFRERYTVQAPSTAFMTSADGTIVPAQLRPRVFLLVQHEREQVLY